MNEIDLVGLASLESFLMLKKKKKKSLPTCNNVKVVAIILNHVALCVCVCVCVCVADLNVECSPGPRRDVSYQC